MMFLGERGYSVIAHDRRGHGRSGQTWDGNDMDTYADDLAELIDELDLKDIILVGHSTAAARSPSTAPVGREGGAAGRGSAADAQDGGQSGRHADGGVRPYPQGHLREPFSVLQGLEHTFYGYNRPGAVSDGLRDSFWLQGMQAGIKPAYDCIKQFSETDFSEDLEKFDVPTLIAHGDDDQIVPIGPPPCYRRRSSRERR